MDKKRSAKLTSDSPFWRTAWCSSKNEPAPSPLKNCPLPSASSAFPWPQRAICLLLKLISLEYTPMTKKPLRTIVQPPLAMLHAPLSGSHLSLSCCQLEGGFGVVGDAVGDSVTSEYSDRLVGASEGASEGVAVGERDSQFSLPVLGNL